MYKKLFMAAALTTVCIQTNAQTVATDYKGTSNNNPISVCVFCADPTALEYKGRLYVYGSNDHQQFIKQGKKGENNYGEIKSLVVFSTDDMVTGLSTAPSTRRRSARAGHRIPGIRAMACRGHHQSHGVPMRTELTSSSSISVTAATAWAC